MIYSWGIVCWLVAVLLFRSTDGDDFFSDHDLDYYPESHNNFELDFLDAETHSYIPDHDSSEADTPPGQVRDTWQQHLGDEVRGGYTVRDLDGTVTHYTYSRSRPYQEESYF